MEAKLMDLNNLSWQRWLFALPNDEEKYIVWATTLFLSSIMHRKVIQVKHFIFFCHIRRIMACWDPEILLPQQRGITTSPLYYLLLCHSSATATFIRSCLLSTRLSASIALNWIPNPTVWSICRMLLPNTISGREGSSSSAEILHMINRKNNNKVNYL